MKALVFTLALLLPAVSAWADGDPPLDEDKLFGKDSGVEDLTKEGLTQGASIYRRGHSLSSFPGFFPLGRQAGRASLLDAQFAGCLLGCTA
jgi:hypothetical protein